MANVIVMQERQIAEQDLDLVRGRDAFLGWDRSMRACHLQRLTNNTRILIPGGVQVPHQAGRQRLSGNYPKAGDYLGSYLARQSCRSRRQR